MRISARRSVALLLTLPAVSFASCTSEGGPAVARDEPGSVTASMPKRVPGADGPVRTANLATVIDTGKGPVELCLSAVAESYPPQCDGAPVIPNWDWEVHGGGGFEEAAGVRWGLYSLTGTWDGSEFSVSDTIIAALYDSFVEEPSEPPAPEQSYPREELEEIADLVDGGLAGTLGARVEAEHVFADVIYDDGSLQTWVDDAYGDNVVLVTSALVDVEPAGVPDPE